MHEGKCGTSWMKLQVQWQSVPAGWPCSFQLYQLDLLERRWCCSGIHQVILTNNVAVDLQRVGINVTKGAPRIYAHTQIRMIAAPQVLVNVGGNIQAEENPQAAIAKLFSWSVQAGSNSYSGAFLVITRGFPTRPGGDLYRPLNIKFYAKMHFCGEKRVLRQIGPG